MGDPMPFKAPTYRPPRPPARDGRPSASARGYGAYWRKLRLTVLARSPLCQAKGCRAPSVDIDHKLAKAKGGTDDMGNLVAYCHSCHSKKTAREDGSFGM